jgi:hypothetical protein
MDQKNVEFYAYNSAKYEVKRDKWKKSILKSIIIGHEYNLERMISGVKNRWSTTRQTSVPTSTTRFELWNIQEH